MIPTVDLSLSDPALVPHKDHGLPRGGRAARDAAREIDRTSGSRVATPVRKAFVRSDDDEDGFAPLVELYRGGRSGIVPLKLYLALLWRSSSAPWTSDKPSRAWAVLLGLDDPSGAGSRRIRAALKTLAEANLVTLEPRKGHSPSVTLLREDGSGGRYAPPSETYQRAERGGKNEAALRRHRYFKVNSKLWTTGELQGLSGPALVLLLILLSERGGDGNEVWFSTSAFQERYGLSPTTRAKGVKELQRRALLTVLSRSLPGAPGGTVFDPLRRRHVYLLRGAALTGTTQEPPTRRSRPRRAGFGMRK